MRHTRNFGVSILRGRSHRECKNKIVLYFGRINEKYAVFVLRCYRYKLSTIRRFLDARDSYRTITWQLRKFRGWKSRTSPAAVYYRKWFYLPQGVIRVYIEESIHLSEQLTQFFWMDSSESEDAQSISDKKKLKRNRTTTVSLACLKCKEKHLKCT